MSLMDWLTTLLKHEWFHPCWLGYLIQRCWCIYVGIYAKYATIENYTTYAKYTWYPSANLQSQIFQNCQTKPSKPNLPDQTYEPNLPKQIYRTKPAKLNKSQLIYFYLCPVFVSIGFAMSGVILWCERACVIFQFVDLFKAVNAWICSAFGNLSYMYLLSS